MNIEKNTRKISIRTIEDFNSLDYEKVMYPVIMYGKEKIDNNMYDDWDEYKHTRKMIEGLKKNFQDNQDIKIDIYCIEDNNLVIGVCFYIFGEDYMKSFIEKIEDEDDKTINKSAQLTCFHILKKYRGIGTRWLKEVIFPDLIKSNIQNLYVKSSHNRALHTYQRLGKQIGQYIGISDNELYQRLGHIYMIKTEQSS